MIMSTIATKRVTTTTPHMTTIRNLVSPSPKPEVGDKEETVVVMLEIVVGDVVVGIVLVEVV